MEQGIDGDSGRIYFSPFWVVDVDADAVVGVIDVVVDCDCGSEWYAVVVEKVLVRDFSPRHSDNAEQESASLDDYVVFGYESSDISIRSKSIRGLPWSANGSASRRRVIQRQITLLTMLIPANIVLERCK
jgi:hypothetical protein